MLSAGAWKLSQQNLITFVLVDANGNEVTALGGNFTLQLSKAGGAFQASAGVKAEIGNGWYSYLATASEADTPGPVAIQVTGGGIVSQNLEYVVESRNVTAVEFTYTVTNDVTSDPIDGVQVWISTDEAASNVVWSGFTDGFGVARDTNGYKPRLDPGLYFIRLSKAGFSFAVDQEDVG